MSLRDALSVINTNAQGICFVTKKGKAVGVLTDGDIRRLFLANVSLEDPVADHMQKNYVALSVNENNETIQRNLSQKIRHIPLIDDKGILVDYACLDQYRNIPLVDPLLDGNELAYVTDCITRKWISSQGDYVGRFERLFSEYIRMPEAVSVSNCTCALELGLRALGIGPGDEVIVPDLTFAASANAVIHVGASPVLVDILEDSWTIDPDRVRLALTQKTRAIMPVHLYGHPCQMDPLLKIARENDLYIIEDCAEALGSLYQGQAVGSFGDAACFSFFGNKTITTGEGGMLLLKNPEVAMRARMLRDHGMSRKRRYWHETVGYNFRMTNLQAAVGVAQMERIDEFIAHKRRLAEIYANHLSGIPELRLPIETSQAFSTYWLYTVMLKDGISISRDALIKRLLYNGIETRPVFTPLHCMPIYQPYSSGQKFEVASHVGTHGISLPTAVTLDSEHIAEIARVLKRLFRTNDFNLASIG